MRGMHRQTGKALSDEAHLQQSIHDILSTPLGTRVMRRDYGSRLFELMDQPINARLLFELSVATAQALLSWEPRLTLARVEVKSVLPGKITLILSGHYQGKADRWHLVDFTL